MLLARVTGSMLMSDRLGFGRGVVDLGLVMGIQRNTWATIHLSIGDSTIRYTYTYIMYRHTIKFNEVHIELTLRFFLRF